MGFKVRTTPLYDERLESAFSFLECVPESERATSRFLGELENKMRLLESFPLAFPEDPILTKAAGTPIRKMAVASFLLSYAVNEGDGVVYLLTLRHQKADPSSVVPYRPSDN